MFMNTITGEYYGKETTKREPSKDFEEVSKKINHSTTYY